MLGVADSQKRQKVVGVVRQRPPPFPPSKVATFPRGPSKSRILRTPYILEKRVGPSTENVGDRVIDLLDLAHSDAELRKLLCQRDLRPIGPLGVSKISFAYDLRSVKTKIGWNPMTVSHFWSAKTIAYVSCSGGVQFCWPVVSLLDMKPTGTVRFFKASSAVGNQFPSGSCSSTAPTAYLLASTRKTNGLSGFTRCKLSSEQSCALMASNAF